MKAEYLAQKCPKCDCQDKRISRRRKGKGNEDAFYIPHVPQAGVGIIRCSECGYIFEYCKEREPVLKVKKLLV